MKRNGNNLNVKDYYIGLDIGTSSVGFATTDKDYVIKRHNGKDMWGVRLFDEGETAQVRRVNRTNRRRLSRRNQRLELLRQLFDEEISKIDSGFFMRLKESFLTVDAKSKGAKYSLFADDGFTDKDYMKAYKTIYHLRNELVKSDSPKDVRLVYLAIRHIVKNRGHFLFDVDSENNQGFDTRFEEFRNALEEILDISVEIDKEKAHEIITRKASKSDKVKELISLVKVDKDNKKPVERLFALIVGGTAKLGDIFGAEVTKTSLSFDMGDEKMLEAAEEIGDGFDLIVSAKAIYDSLILEKITKGFDTLSEYKINEYNEHERDIRQLKDFVKNVLKNTALYREIFKQKKENLNNYSAYSGYRKSDKECHCTQADFCKYLKGKLPQEYASDESFAQMYQRINEGVFAPKLRKTENGVIPNSLHRGELVAILNNASKYLDFLNSVDEDGISVKEKIISIFDFRIPYYVGPLKSGWMVRREDGIIYPWNFEKKVNLEASAEKFIEKMTSICTYTGDDVLPKNSLLYSEFEVLNEINNLKINGEPITVSCKKLIYEELFVKQNKKVTKKKIVELLKKEGLFFESDEIGGIDDNVKSQLSSYHKLKRIIEKTSYEIAEEIIKKIVLFGDDKKLLKSYLSKDVKLSEDDVKYVSSLKFEGWGRLSERLLNGFVDVNKETAEAMTVIEMMRETNLNLMKLLSGNYTFKSQADEYKAEKLGIGTNPRDMVDALYVSPKVRRGIWQTIRIVDELVDIENGAPDKIFIEVTRHNESEEEKNKNSASRRSRKEQLIGLYKECKRDSDDLFKALEKESEDKLRRKKLFLYYQQFGKCMYSGEPIELEDLEKDGYYDLDHIYPRSKIKDDSFDNLVLVKAELNREKTNIYPIQSDIRNNMRGYWEHLRKINAISPKKYERLTRSTPLTADELSSFINRQIVETSQSSKAIAEVFNVIYPNTKIVYSKAGNVSDFRKHFDFIKCRDINDLHHAKDAYLNVVVGNYFDTRFTQSFVKNITEQNYSLNVDALYKFNVRGAWKSGDDGTISTVKKMMKKNSVLYTVMPYEEKGQLYKVTILPKGKGQVPIKNGLDIKTYGGYNNAAGAYFAIVEHTEKGKNIRSIEAVLIYQKVEYERNPEEFAKKYWYSDARIIMDKVLTESFLELDGLKGYITGRSCDYVMINHAYQLIVSDDIAKYIKALLKATEESISAKRTEISSKEITSMRNVEIYDCLLEKMEKCKYGEIYPKMKRLLSENKDRFVEMSTFEQGKVTIEILKALKCNGGAPSLESLCGDKHPTDRRHSKKLTTYSSAYLIHQSVTGIFEKKIDLLK